MHVGLLPDLALWDHLCCIPHAGRLIKNVTLYLPSFEMDGYIPKRMKLTSRRQLEDELDSKGYDFATKAGAIVLHAYLASLQDSLL